MCAGVKFTHAGENLTVYFPNPKAVLPVALRDGGHELVTWGRRKEEPGKLPPGGWARLDSIKAGKWDKYIPTPVHFSVQSFMEKDEFGQSHWYPVQNIYWIQGLLAWDRGERRVYVVTIEPEEKYRGHHDRWPRFVFAYKTLKAD